MVALSVTRLAYVSLFGLTTVACLGCLVRTRHIEDADTRRGLEALLLLSALWAATQAGHVFISEPWLAQVAYILGLVVGLATVGAWLYFCSAYAGRSYHKKPLYRRLALAVYIPIVSFKLTNPWHGLYFETTTILTPFRYVAIQEQPIFWIIAGLSYVLSAIGFYMLLDVLEESRTTSRAAKVIVLLAALPVVFDIVGYLSPPPLLELNYESVGVSLFAIGALFVAREPFFAVSQFGRAQLLDKIDDAVLVLDRNDRVQEYNDAALDLFPELAQREMPHIRAVANDIDVRHLSDDETIELQQHGEARYFIIRTTPINVGATEIGHGVIFTDVTEIERQRQDLRRKDEQLEGFATAITHELRNSVGMVSGQAALLSQSAAETDNPEIQSRVETIIEETSDMEQIVEELNTLARYSQSISETTFGHLGDISRSAKRQADVDSLDLVVERANEIEADQDRLQELFQQVFKFAVRNGASKITVRGHDGGFTVEDDGQPLGEYGETEVFAYGNAVPDPDTAVILPNVQMLTISHGWQISINSGYTDGTQITIDGANTKP